MDTVFHLNPGWVCKVRDENKFILGSVISTRVTSMGTEIIVETEEEKEKFIDSIVVALRNASDVELIVNKSTGTIQFRRSFSAYNTALCKT